MSKISNEEIIKELERSSERIKNAGAEKPKLFRAPSGAYSNELIKTASEQGYVTVQWDVDSRDWKNYTPEKITESIAANAGKGSIILFHSGKENTLQALGNILEILQNRGFEFVKVSELIYSGNYTIDHTGRQHSLE